MAEQTVATHNHTFILRPNRQGGCYISRSLAEYGKQAEVIVEGRELDKIGGVISTDSIPDQGTAFAIAYRF